MTKNEIKKELYKDKRVAFKTGDVPEGKTYHCQLKSGQVVYFMVDAADQGTTAFHFQMPAHELLRWLVYEEPRIGGAVVD